MKVSATLLTLALTGYGAVVQAASSGMIGHSGKDPNKDCSACHIAGAEEPQITVAGPVTVDIDSTVTYTLSLHGAPRSVGGINVAASAGALGTAGDDTRLVDGELTQRTSRIGNDTGTVRFKFHWRAPNSPGTHTLFIAAVSGNANRSPAGDGVLQTNVKVNVIDRSAESNEPPRAHVQLPPAARVGEKVLLSAVQSTDVDGKIASYAWDFGDGEQKSGQVPALQHKYRAPGVYTLQLTVTDDDGATGSVLAQIEVTASDRGSKRTRPRAVLGGPDQVAFGEPVQFDASKSRPSRKKGRIAAYEWDFGDGYHGSGAAPTHYYAQPGSYMVTLTVWDDRDLPDSTTGGVRVRQGQWPRLGKFRVPDKITLKDGQPQPSLFNIVVDIGGLGSGVSRCAVIYLERNNQPYQNKSVCFVGSGRQRIMFEHKFTDADAPSVTWTAYMVLEPDVKSRNDTKTTRVQIDSADQPEAANK